MANLTSMGGVPRGIIAMWSGALADLPSGWALCDGANGTPDLRGRFIVGSQGEYATGDTGGAESVTLTEAQMPGHSHTAQNAGGHDHGGNTGTDGSHVHSGDTTSDGYHSHSGDTNTTGSHKHNVLTDWSPSGTYSRSSIDTENPADYHGSDASPQYSSGPDANYLTSAGNHSHSLNINGNGNHTHSLNINSAGNHSHTIESDGSHAHTIEITGGDEAHENRPPFYALAYVMKV